MDKQLISLFASVMTALASQLTPTQIRAAAAKLRNQAAADDWERESLDEWADRLEYIAEHHAEKEGGER